MSEPIVVFGADDPEMRAIKARAYELELETTQALDRVNTRPVHCGAAYDALVDYSGPLIERAGLVVVETRVPEYDAYTVDRLDHHNVGDRGFDLPPEQAVAASSLGQFAEHYGFELSDRERVLAAVDHSFFDAMRGRVPDVDPAQALQVKIEEIANSHSVEISAISSDVETARQFLDEAPRIAIHGAEVCDLSEFYLGEPDSRIKLAIQTAAVVDEKALLIHFADFGAGGDHKLMLNGAVSPEDCEYFMTTWAPQHGLERIFGNPSRHYAGAYTTAQTRIE